MQFCAMQGKRPIALSKDFTVEGLDGYVYDFSQIPADLLKQMDEKVQGILQGRGRKYMGLGGWQR